MYFNAVALPHIAALGCSQSLCCRSYAETVLKLPNVYFRCILRRTSSITSISSSLSIHSGIQENIFFSASKNLSFTFCFDIRCSSLLLKITRPPGVFIHVKFIKLMLMYSVHTIHAVLVAFFTMRCGRVWTHVNTIYFAIASDYCYGSC